MKPSRPLATGASVAGAFLILVIFTILFIPAREIRDTLARGLKRQGYSLRTGYFGKAFPLGIKTRNLEILDERGSLVKLDEVTARIAILPLLVGKVVVNYHAEIGKGTIEGYFSPRWNREFSAVADNVQLEDIPFFQTVAGARVKGNMSSNVEFRGESNGFRGDARISVKGAVLNGLKIGGIPLPDASYETIQGMYRVNGGKGNLESFSLQGRGIYVRLRGGIPFTSPPGSAPINLTLELMPKPAFLENQKLVFLLLVKYLTSPGHYQIPIRGTLAKPAIQ
jgi:type II secretion system protein N